MPTILKEGKPNIQPVIHYKYTCKRCECKFEFRKEEFKRAYADLGGLVGPTTFYNIICPYCKQHNIINTQELDKLEKEIREVELEWQETEDEYFEQFFKK